MHEMYVIQGLMSDAIICNEFSVPEEVDARRQATDLLKSPTFEGDSVRIITREGELVWNSKG